MFQSIAILGVIEEAKRKTQHLHLLSWNKCKPEMLECLSSYSFWANKICIIVDSIFKTELPASLHLKIILQHEVGNVEKPRSSREQPGGDISINGNKVASLTGIHKHMLSSCVANGQSIEWLHRQTDINKCTCRFGYGCRMCNTTKFVEISEDLHDSRNIIIGNTTNE